ncbi:branched-chain amino acid transport system substrate-binding protein, partial [Enterobacter roggenkampii]
TGTAQRRPLKTLTPPAALTARRSNWFRGMTPASLSRRWRWPTA